MQVWFQAQWSTTHACVVIRSYFMINRSKKTGKLFACRLYADYRLASSTTLSTAAESPSTFLPPAVAK